MTGGGIYERRTPVCVSMPESLKRNMVQESNDAGVWIERTGSVVNFIPIFKYFYSRKSFVVRFWGTFFRTAKRVTTMTTMACSHFCSQLLEPFFSFTKQKKGLTTRNVVSALTCAHVRDHEKLVVRGYEMIGELEKYTLKPDYKTDYKLTTLTTTSHGYLGRESA